MDIRTSTRFHIASSSSSAPGSDAQAARSTGPGTAIPSQRHVARSSPSPARAVPAKLLISVAGLPARAASSAGLLTQAVEASRNADAPVARLLNTWARTGAMSTDQISSQRVPTGVVPDGKAGFPSETLSTQDGSDAFLFDPPPYTLFASPDGQSLPVLKRNGKEFDIDLSSTRSTDAFASYRLAQTPSSRGSSYRRVGVDLPTPFPVSCVTTIPWGVMRKVDPRLAMFARHRNGSVSTMPAYLIVNRKLLQGSKHGLVIDKALADGQKELHTAMGDKFALIDTVPSGSPDQEIAVLVVMPSTPEAARPWIFPVRSHHLSTQTGLYAVWGRAQQIAQAFAVPVLPRDPQREFANFVRQDESRPDVTDTQFSRSVEQVRTEKGHDSFLYELPKVALFTSPDGQVSTAVFRDHKGIHIRLPTTRKGAWIFASCKPGKTSSSAGSGHVRQLEAPLPQALPISRIVPLQAVDIPRRADEVALLVRDAKGAVFTAPAYLYATPEQLPRTDEGAALAKALADCQAELQKAMGDKYALIRTVPDGTPDQEIAVLLSIPPTPIGAGPATFPVPSHRLSKHPGVCILWGAAQAVAGVFAVPVLPLDPLREFVNFAHQNPTGPHADTHLGALAKIAAWDPQIEMEIWNRALRKDPVPEFHQSINRVIMWAAALGSSIRQNLMDGMPVITRDGRFGIIHRAQDGDTVEIEGPPCEHLRLRSRRAPRLSDSGKARLYELQEKLPDKVAFRTVRSIPVSAWNAIPDGALVALCWTTAEGIRDQRVGHFADLSDPEARKMIRADTRLRKELKLNPEFLRSPRSCIDGQVAFALCTLEHERMVRPQSKRTPFPVAVTLAPEGNEWLFGRGPIETVCDAIFVIELPEEQRDLALASKGRELAEHLCQMTFADFATMKEREWMDTLEQLNLGGAYSAELIEHLGRIAHELAEAGDPMVPDLLSVFAPFVIKRRSNEREELMRLIKERIQVLEFERSTMLLASESSAKSSSKVAQQSAPQDFKRSRTTGEIVPPPAQAPEMNPVQVPGTGQVQATSQPMLGSPSSALPTAPTPVSRIQERAERARRHRDAETARAQGLVAGPKGVFAPIPEPVQDKKALARPLDDEDRSSSGSTPVLGSRVEPLKLGTISPDSFDNVRRLRDLVKQLADLNFAHKNTRGSHARFGREGEPGVTPASVHSKRLSQRVTPSQLGRFKKQFDIPKRP